MAADPTLTHAPASAPKGTNSKCTCRRFKCVCGGGEGGGSPTAAPRVADKADAVVSTTAGTTKDVPNPKFCGECGASAGGGTFCQECGTKLQ